MNHRIMVAFVVTISFHNFLKICSLEHCHQVIYHPRNTVIQFVASNIVEEIAQKGIGFRNQSTSFFSTKVLWGVVVQSSSKHAISNGLSIYIGKVLLSKLLNEKVTERLILSLKCIIGL